MIKYDKINYFLLISFIEYENNLILINLFDN